jgi:hypothetical protein
MISASTCAPPSTGCRSPKIGQHDQETPKTWSRAKWNTCRAFHPPIEEMSVFLWLFIDFQK